MASFVVAKSDSQVAVSESIRRFRNSEPIYGADNNLAAGRVVLALNKNSHGQWQVVTETITDATGNYTLSVNSSDADRFVVVIIGDPALDENAKVLANMTAVI